MEFKKTTIEDVLSELPNIQEVDFTKFGGQYYDLLIQAVGFEARTIGMAKKLSAIGNKKTAPIKIRESILIKYETNTDDNLFHLNKLVEFLEPISDLTTTLDFNNSFHQIIHNKVKSYLKEDKDKVLKILLDLSTMSSSLILLLTKLLFQTPKIELTILFTEAKVYYPTPDSYDKMKLDSKNEIENAQSFGVGNVNVSPDYNGGTKDNQDLIICFPSFSAERTQAIITYIDDLIIKQNDHKRLIWIVGDPHFGDDSSKEQRRKLQIEINNINDKQKVYTVCTFDYKKTLEMLDHIYRDSYSNYNINISDLGSKMQSLGIALFGNLRRDVTIYYSEPVKYNSNYYSDGIKDYWMIPVGLTSDFLNQLFRVGTVEFSPDASTALN